MLAQTTQVSVHVWTSSDVILVITAIATVLIPALIALVKSFKNDGVVQAQAESITRVTNRMNTQDAKINDVAIAAGTAGPPGPKGDTGATGEKGDAGDGGPPRVQT